MNADWVNIIGPMPLLSEAIDADKLSIFVDGGAKHKSKKFRNAFSVGDSDSSGRELDIKLSPDKDRGDLYHAVCEARARGAKLCRLYGFFGGRLDHQILLIGDLLHLSEEFKLEFILYEGHFYRLNILPPGCREFCHRGIFSVFSLKEQEVFYRGDCKFPTDKEYPQLIPPLSTQGLGNISYSSFTLEFGSSLCVYFAPTEGS